MRDLGDLTTHCIRCGFCLESCPTFQITGSELESPRGRIYLIRSALEGRLDWQNDVRLHLDRCLGCRACETACPSGVEYGAILEGARARLQSEKPRRALRGFLNGVSSPRALRSQLAMGAMIPGRKVPKLLSRLLSGEAPTADKPRRPRPKRFPLLDESQLPAICGEVYLLEGCAMRVLFPNAHGATRRLLRRVGYRVREASQGCCGALHLHSGFLPEAVDRARRLVEDLSDDLPVVVNSAGCGSTMKEYGELFELGSAFAGRVFDVAEFLMDRGLVEPLSHSPGLSKSIAYHDACHLAHGQGIRNQPRTLLAAIPNARIVELPNSDRCCGSAGIYNMTQPSLAKRLLELKWGDVEASGAEIVALGNPGCHAWLAQAGRERGSAVRVMHTVEVLEASFGEGAPV